MADALKMRGVSKRFPGVVALDNVDLTVGEGEIHAIVGENGAGKSTLMRILSGATRMDRGEIRINDVAVEIGSSQQAINLGIGTVYQNLNLITDLTVAENIYMNRFPRHGGFIDRRKITDGASRALREMNSDIAPSTRVGDLSVADQQMVAIARVLAYDIKILILDEPTSSLSKAESEDLFRNMRRLKSLGVSIIFISHHMDEIFSVTDAVTVLRDGRLVGRWQTDELDEHALVHHMVGREVTEMFPKEIVPIGDVVLKAEHVSVDGLVHDVSFCVRKGEVLGIGGLVGAGRTELVKSVFGACPRRSGDIVLDGQPIDIRSPRQAVEAGIAFVPEDRRREGLITEFSIEDNISLGSIWDLTRHFSVDFKAGAKLSEGMIQTMNVKTPSRKQLVKNLSGGNQQKVVLGKWFCRRPKVLIFDEPTRGIDVGAKAEIYRKISDLAKGGVAVIIVSSELPELMGISDRIIVLNKGRMTGEFMRPAFSADQIMLAATGKAGTESPLPRGQQE